MYIGLQEIYLLVDPKGYPFVPVIHFINQHFIKINTLIFIFVFSFNFLEYVYLPH